MAKNYGDTSIKTLDPVTHIRMRPGMYVGEPGTGAMYHDCIYILMKEVRVFGRYLKNVQHEIDTILTSLREQIRFAKNNVKELSDDADLLYASIEDDVQARIGDYLFRLAGEEDEIASIKREIGSCCSHVIRRCAEERLELHEDEQRELEFALHCELMQLLNAFVAAKPKSDL